MNNENAVQVSLRGEPSPGHPVFQLRNARLSVRASAQSLLAVDELTLYPAERVVITGPSGAGKSLLLSMITGRWAPALEFCGTRTCHASRIGYIPQRGQDALHPLLPLGRQLAKATAAAAQRVGEVLAAVGLDDPRLHRRRPAELSGGQGQRAAIALAVLSGAPLILADEPTSALDHSSRDRTLSMLQSVLTEKQTLVMVTHDPVAAQALATRQLAVDSGRIIPLQSAAAQRATA
ncbi:MAG: ATP-binding cassette domain-containing protein [Glutamicibacter arilaitensis]|uniref:ATP-binding cassette domain-containing protein n=1 Tax=Glutamicibacter arilaitensis TaxID=256701 RepID=UPI003F8F3561